MSHDKISAAARKRMAETGEPYAAARRAVVSEHQAARGQVPPPSAGYVLRMSGEIHDWLTDLRGSDPPAATRVRRALVTLMEKGEGLGDPLVASTAESWPWALAEALDRSYQQDRVRLQALRLGEADAVTLSRDIQDQIAELESAQDKLADMHHRALEAGRQPEAAQAAGQLAVARRQAAEVRRLLPGVTEAARRLKRETPRLQARVEAIRLRQEARKASFVAAQSSLRVREAIAASGLPGDDTGRPQDDSSGELRAAEARLADLTAQMEREAGQQSWPQGLLALRPGALDRDDICILFAVEPPGAALLIAVLEGLEAVATRYGEAILAAADMLRHVRADQAPEAAAYAYNDTGSFLAEFP